MSLAYVASPYTKFVDGLDAAHEVAARLTGRLLASGVIAYSPIAHCHPMAVYAALDPLDIPIWYGHNLVMMRRCDTLIVAHLPGWEESEGVKFEIDHFAKAGKPIFDLDPVTLKMVRRQ
jgi:hypothetical protein